MEQQQNFNETLPTMAALNSRRREFKISALALYRRAGIGHKTWFEGVAGRRGTTTTTLQKLSEALDALIAEQLVEKV